MKDREELIWEAVKKCKLESAFWKLTKVFPSTEGMVSVLYRRQEQEEQIQKIWCKRIGIAVLFYSYATWQGGLLRRKRRYKMEM